jgi:hypothetical protein
LDIDPPGLIAKGSTVIKIEDLDFGESGRVDRPGLGLWLPGGYWAIKKWFEIARTLIQTEWPRLDWTVPQTAETLCGISSWRTYEVRERIKLGRCIKYFVDHEMLALKVANPKKKGKRFYKRQH